MFEKFGLFNYSAQVFATIQNCCPFLFSRTHPYLFIPISKILKTKKQGTTPYGSATSVQRPNH
jgi:hypothetical protein